MKARYFKSTLLAALLLTMVLGLKAQTLREENQKEFPVSAASTLTIENQFGNITVTNWDQNKVVITYIIEVTAEPEAKAKKLMDQIKIEFSEGGDKIFAKTKIGKDGNINMKTDRAEKQSFKIDYFVKCPKNISIRLENQFGDVSIGSMTGLVDLDVQFGSINAVSLTGAETNISLQFGKATLGDIKKASVEIQHSEMVKISSVSSLEIESQFSELSIGSVNELSGEISNGSTEIEKLTGSLSIEANMGSISVKNVATGFLTIEIEQNMGEIALSMDPKAGYKLTANATMGDVSVPSGFKAEKTDDKGSKGLTSSKIKGTVGDGSGKVELKVNMGSIKIK